MKKFSPSFFIGTISIGTVEGASCVNLGNNFPTGFVSNKKHNQGFGSIAGDHNDIDGIMASLEEKDINDSFSYGLNENEPLNKLATQMLETDLEIEEVDTGDEHSSQEL